MRVELHRDHRDVERRCVVHVAFQIYLSLLHRGEVRVQRLREELHLVVLRFLVLRYGVQHCGVLRYVRQRLRVELKILLVARYALMSAVLRIVMSRVLRRLSAMLHVLFLLL